MNIKNGLVGFSLFLFLCVGCASADTEKHNLVGQLLTLTKAAEQIERVSIQAVHLFVGQKLAQNPKIPDTEKQQVMTIITETFRESIPELMVPLGKIYEQTFTSSELQELVVFYKTDIGKKLVDSQPILFQKAMIVGAAWGQKIQKESMRRIKEKLASKGYKI